MLEVSQRPWLVRDGLHHLYKSGECVCTLEQLPVCRMNSTAFYTLFKLYRRAAVDRTLKIQRSQSWSQPAQLISKETAFSVLQGMIWGPVSFSRHLFPLRDSMRMTRYFMLIPSSQQHLWKHNEFPLREATLYLVVCVIETALSAAERIKSSACFQNFDNSTARLFLTRRFDQITPP